jgi:hypothetical protein
MMTGSFVKFKGSNPEYWDIDPNRIYIVQKDKYNGGQNFIFLFNKHHKLRQYYQHLFEEIKVYPSTSVDMQKVEELKKIWLKDNSEASKCAYDTLTKSDAEWRKMRLFKKGRRVKFISGIEADKYKDRTFLIQEDEKFTVMFASTVRLTGLYGKYDTSKLEVIR